MALLPVADVFSWIVVAGRCRFAGNVRSYCALRRGFENNVSQIKISGYQDGALADVIHSGKWDDAKVKQQLAAFGQLDQQVRYYRVKYYFDVSQVLTPEQREQVKKDLSAAIN